jgi:acetyl esterase/lipase
MNSKCTALAILLFFPLSICYSQANAKSQLNIPYTSGADTLQQLDVFWNGSKKKNAVLVFFHGGGFLSGNKADYREMASHLSTKEMTVVLVNYRLSPRVKYPSHEEDAAAAVAWVFHNIKDFCGDKNQIYLLGHSAGAHLASLLVFNQHFMSQTGTHASVIKGVITVSGVFEVKPQEGGATEKYLGMVFGDRPDIWAEASCKSHVRDINKLPPFLVAWSAEESTLIVNESKNLVELLRTQNKELETYTFPGKEHNSFLKALMDTESEFFERLKKLMK